MKNALIMFGVLSVALMGTWGMCAIHGQTAAQPLSALGFQQGLYAPMELTWLDGLFQSLYGATPFILTADKEEEAKAGNQRRRAYAGPGPNLECG